MAATLSAVTAVLLSVMTPLAAHAETPRGVGGVTSGYTSYIAPQLVELSINGKLLTNNGNSHSAGTRIDLWDRAVYGGRTQANQIWQFVLPLNGAIIAAPNVETAAFTSGSWGQLRNTESGLCLQLPTLNLDINVPTTQVPCDEGAQNQKWSSVRQPSGGYAVQSGLGKAYLGFNRPYCGDGAATGDVVTVRDEGSLRCATWQVTPVVPMGGTPVLLTTSANNDGSGLSNYVLDSANTSGSWGTPAQTRLRGNGVYGTSTQQWYEQYVGLTRNANGSQTTVMRYVNAPNGDWSRAVCLDAFGGSVTPGSVVGTYGCDVNGANALNQLWANYSDTNLTRGQMSLVRKRTLVSAVAVATQWGGSATVASVANTITPRDGSIITMQAPGSTVLPMRTQLWEPVPVPAAPTSQTPTPVVPATSNCRGYACLISF